MFGHLPPDRLQVLENKLRALERFLAEISKRRKARGFGKAAGGSGPGGQHSSFLGGHLEDGTNRMLNAGNALAVAGAGDAPFAKRQRMWNAFVMEEQRNNAVRCACYVICYAGTNEGLWLVLHLCVCVLVVLHKVYVNKC
jgi:hypothetical protein